MSNGEVHLWDNPQEPKDPNGKFSCLTVIGLVLIVAVIAALVLQSLDQTWPFP